MKRFFLACGLLFLNSHGVLAAENMLQWCLKSYPDKIEWCQRQYPDESSSTAQTPKFVESDKKIQKIFSSLERRLEAKYPRVKLTPDNNFDFQPINLMEALKPALNYADVISDDQTCTEGDENFQCFISNDDVTITVAQARSVNRISKVHVEYVVEGAKSRRDSLINFAVIADALSRVLDSGLSDDERDDVFAKLAEDYFYSERVGGIAFGKQVKYALTEEGGNLQLTITPEASANQKRKFTESNLNPIKTLMEKLNRGDLLKPDPLMAADVQAAISDMKAKIHSLLQELDGFRYSKHFHTYGFSSCCVFKDWMSRTRELQPPSDEGVIKDAMLAYGILSARVALIGMGLDYMHALGRDTPETIEARKTIMKALNSKR